MINYTDLVCGYRLGDPHPLGQFEIVEMYGLHDLSDCLNRMSALGYQLYVWQRDTQNGKVIAIFERSETDKEE